MSNSLFYALEDFEYVVRCNCQCCVTDAEATTDAQVNESSQKVLDTAQADLDAAVAAFAEKVVKSIEDLMGHHGINCDGAPYVDYEALQYGDALLSEVIHECVRALINTDALAERDAKVRADALREALTPSGATKAAYIGEFAFPVDRLDENGNEYSEMIGVPWTTIKEIMAAIAARAALEERG